MDSAELRATAETLIANDNLTLPVIIEPGPLLHAESRGHEPLIKDEINRIIQDCRYVYTEYQSIGALLLVSLGVTMFLIPFIIEDGPTVIVHTDMSAATFVFKFVILFMYPTTYAQAYTMVLMYQKRFALRGWVKTLSRFMLISFFAIIYHFRLFKDIENRFLGLWFATPFGFHLVLSLLWAARWLCRKR